MYDEKSKQLQKQFNKVYIDTIKHCQDIEKWIKSDKRKQSDIRRSLDRLTKKYVSLCELKTELVKNNITEEDALNNIPNYKNMGNLAEIKSKIETLYSSVGLIQPIKSMYDEKIELAEDILVGVNTEPEEKIKFEYDDRDFVIGIPAENDIEKNKQIDHDFIFNIPEEETSKRIKSMYNNEKLASDISNSKKEDTPLVLEKMKQKSLIIKVKEKFGKIKEKIKNIASDFRNSKKNNPKSKGRLAKRMAALGMALTMGFLGSATVGENMSKSDDTKNNKSYTDTNHENNDFKDSIYNQALKATEETKATVDVIENTKNTENVQESAEYQEENNEKQENKKVIEKENSEELFLARANTQYTEVSDGSGNSGYFVKDTKVKVYNRALIKICEDRSKKILKATKVAQTWEQYAEEKGIDYKEFKEYMENNENIHECVSIQSEDGKTLYGWLSIDELENIEIIENMEEIER